MTRFSRDDSRANAAPPRDGWEIIIAGDLTEKQNELMDRMLDIPPRSSGLIYFESCGGSAYVGIGLATMIRLRGLQATAVVLGECSSAALLPFAACEKRYVTAHSTLYFHPVRWSSEEDVKLEEAAEWTRHFKVLEDDFDQMLSQMLHVSPEQILAWTRPGRFLTGSECIAAGFAQELNLFTGDLWQQLNLPVPL